MNEHHTKLKELMLQQLGQYLDNLFEEAEDAGEEISNLVLGVQPEAGKGDLGFSYLLGGKNLSMDRMAEFPDYAAKALENILKKSAGAFLKCNPDFHKKLEEDLVEYLDKTEKIIWN